MNVFKKVLSIVAPDAKKASDGRDQWPSRASFVLAAMGGAVGLGNILRYPSVVFENNGLQWFLPYLIALIFLAIPLLILEISIGQAARGGGVIAFNTVSKRARGVGVGTIMTGYMVATYYVPILSWVMVYFRHSFYTPLAWDGRGEEFYMKDVIANTAPIPGTFNDNGSVATYSSYPDVGLVGETVGWVAFVWFVVYLCMFKGVGLSGRVVYFTMGMPIVIVFILLGRGVSLPNAIDGIKLYVGHWDSSKLASGQIWQAAAGQIFFSTGVGFGYFTAFASYNPTFANAVQDSIIVACANSLFEVVGAFAVFGIVGFLGLKPEEGDKLGTFTVGFLTYPLAITEMPASAFWAVLFFSTIMLVGISSAFALVESVVTSICDTDWGKKIPRTAVCTIVIVVSFLLSLLYCTQFGYYLLDAVDTWLNNFSLLFMAFSECIATTSLYRRKDVIGQIGVIPFFLYNGGYLASIILGVGVAHASTPWAGAIIGFGVFIVCSVVSIFLSKNPDTPAPSFWGNNQMLQRFWWMAFYSGNQLTRDLNVAVATGKNWSIPVYWGPVIKYVSAPILGIIIGFAYPLFNSVRNDPLHIFAFASANVVMVIVVIALIIPRSLNLMLPAARREKVEQYAPGVTMAPVDIDTGAVEESVEESEEVKEKN
ncbi:solute carrier family 6 (neurotransmitter transporter, GABA) member 1 [[Emmonsia] crescens]|uniref:Solute carrier family 6 (Neurotransmitter transporter, GABA) member 1 n=1 Tax=[Emmonsia] crescens TaxID=73230 RepID=A0A2B7Z819_9EURO|nr:solute carrier family 6 (neurotransmitter transporter, GABA) member 1 [Emmonsia crescens]